MFFPDRIISILPEYKVLEIGPGSQPHPRADVYLDKVFSKEESFIQNGLTNNVSVEKPIIYYDGGVFPFNDNEFDYVICSHVIEHIQVEELPLFISELQRIAPRGYIEYPTLFYELIHYRDVHITFINNHDKKILFLDKKKLINNTIYDIYRIMFYSNDNYFYDSYLKYKEFFFFGYEWENKIDYEIVDDFSDLITQKDFLIWQTYFINQKIPQAPLPITIIPPDYDKLELFLRKVYNKYKIFRNYLHTKRQKTDI